MEKIKVIISWSGDNFCAHSEQVSGCFAVGDHLETLKKEFASLLAFHLQGLREDNDPIPKALQGDYHLEFEPTTQALLKQTEKLITRSALARVTGINERLLGNYIQGVKNPRPARRAQIIAGMHQIGKELSAVL